MQVRVFEGSLTNLTPFNQPYIGGEPINSIVIQSCTISLEWVARLLNHPMAISKSCNIPFEELQGDNYEIIWPE